MVGDRAVYDIDAAVLTMTGRAMKLTTPTQILTARDTLEYWSQKHMAVARGDAVAVTNDARRIAGRKSAEIEKLLGFRGRDEIVHRDDLVVE